MRQYNQWRCVLPLYFDGGAANLDKEGRAVRTGTPVVSGASDGIRAIV